jgi:hypothetical protein
MPLQMLFIVGLSCMLAGFGFGVPAGTYYHVKLYKLLALRGPVPRRFWFSPTRFHDQLEPAEWRTVVPWFAIGGAGFLLIILGCLVVMLAVLKA